MHIRMYVHFVVVIDQQISPEELQSDAEVLFAIVERDAEFEGIMRDIDHHKATDAVYEAVKVLHTASEPDTEAERIEFLDLSSEVCVCVCVCVNDRPIYIYLIRPLHNIM